MFRAGDRLIRVLHDGDFRHDDKEERGRESAARVVHPQHGAGDAHRSHPSLRAAGGPAGLVQAHRHRAGGPAAQEQEWRGPATASSGARRGSGADGRSAGAVPGTGGPGEALRASALPAWSDRDAVDTLLPGGERLHEVDGRGRNQSVECACGGVGCSGGPRGPDGDLCRHDGPGSRHPAPQRDGADGAVLLVGEQGGQSRGWRHEGGGHQAGAVVQQGAAEAQELPVLHRHQGGADRASQGNDGAGYHCPARVGAGPWRDGHADGEGRPRRPSPRRSNCTRR